MIDPASRLREGVNLSRQIEVKMRNGGVLLVSPCLITPREILSGRLTSYQCAVLELRNALARNEIFNNKLDISLGIWAQVALGVINANYSITVEELEELQIGDDTECMTGICTVACGRISGILADQRAKALNVSVLGMCDVPLSSIEIAFLSDFAVNSGRAPKLIG